MFSDQSNTENTPTTSIDAFILSKGIFKLYNRDICEVIVPESTTSIFEEPDFDAAIS
jgi:hypothetical protein